MRYQAPAGACTPSATTAATPASGVRVSVPLRATLSRTGMGLIATPATPSFGDVLMLTAPASWATSDTAPAMMARRFVPSKMTLDDQYVLTPVAGAHSAAAPPTRAA